jgi:hypothetical protein
MPHMFSHNPASLPAALQKACVPYELAFSIDLHLPRNDSAASPLLGAIGFWVPCDSEYSGSQVSLIESLESASLIEFDRLR